MTLQKITIKDIGKIFADNGYILADYGIMQYNNDIHKFEYVNDTEVLDIFSRIYPNFERKILKVGMIEQYLPRITDKEFNIYDQVKSKLNPFLLLSDARLKELMQEAIQENENRKKPVVDMIPITDFEQCTQYLINNDIYCSGSNLYKYEDNDFTYFGIYRVQRLFNDVTMDTPTLNETAKIIHICRIELTDIGSFFKDYKARQDKKNIPKEEMQIYSRIENLIKTYKEYIGND